MQFIATGVIANPELLGPHKDEEALVLDALKAEGVVAGAFRTLSTPGVVLVVHAESKAAASNVLARLSFVERGLLSFTFDEVATL